ncbi:MAG: YdiU family protein [Bacteroidetes bacterium]|nr:YdiU family protein [Bacteroidota bacterium]
MLQFNFDNSYLTLAPKLFEKVLPTAVYAPRLVIFNKALAAELGLNSDVAEEMIAELLSGNKILQGSQPIAQAYGGHQFGHFNMLGDGRAILLGEHLTAQNRRFDIQLKGPGATPYSRNGDGRATLSSMLREYIISEAIHALQIPSTRSLAVVATGEEVHREYTHEGGVLTRIAASHIRVGTFEFVRRFNDLETFKTFVDYTIQRHYPEVMNTENPALALFTAVMEKQITLIVNWMRVGFIHGVMNTDNMSICGETIDYGPCAFMNAYHPETVFSSIDKGGRYAFGNQAQIAKWNLTRFVETLLVLIHPESDKAIEMAQEVLQTFNPKFEAQWLRMMRNKLGLMHEEEGDEQLIHSLLLWMQDHGADYTNTFLALIYPEFLKEALYQNDAFKAWQQEWLKRMEIENNLASIELMRQSNPVVIPRNHRVEEALQASAHDGDLAPMNNLLAAIAQPYQKNSEFSQFQNPPADGGKNYKTYCGT